MPNAAKTDRRISPIAWIMLALLAWSLFHVAGAYLHTGLFGAVKALIIYVCAICFLGFWTWMLWMRSRRLARQARTESQQEP